MHALPRPIASAVGPCLGLALLAACSSEPESPGSPPADAAPIDVSTADTDDASETPDDVTSDEPVEETTVAVCPPGSWGNMPDTQCSLINQDCESKLLTCYPNVVNGIPGTSCTYLGYGAKTRGALCDSNNECASGLACLAGNCTPFCCKEHQYEICGPGGQCNFNLTFGPQYHVFVCGYSEPCTVWVNGCPEGEACHALISDGSASCSPPSSGYFFNEGDPCSARNDCGDSQGCISHGGAPSVCRYLCKRGDSPWDAGSPSAGPGAGGCPDGQTCQALNDAPSWLGACLPSAPTG